MSPLLFGSVSVEKVLKQTFRNPEKFVFSCQTAIGCLSLKVARFPPKTGSRRNSVFSPEKPANSSPPSSSPLVTALSPLAFGSQKCAKAAPVPEFRSRRVFRGPTARRGPGSEPDSPPRFRPAVRQPAELVTADVTVPSGSVFGAKSAQNCQLRRVRFSCQSASGMPEPQVSLVFGRKVTFAQDRKKANSIPPSLSPFVTVRHRFVTALLGRKVRKSGSQEDKFESIMEPGDSSMAHEWARHRSIHHK